MAKLAVEGNDLVVSLIPLEKWAFFVSPLRKLAAGRWEVRLPLTAVRSASVVPAPWAVLGISYFAVNPPPRGAATQLPVIWVTQVYKESKTFASCWADRPAVLVELEDTSPIRRLVVRVHSPELVAASIWKPPSPPSPSP
jgi:hypothetical protein